MALDDIAAQDTTAAASAATATATATTAPDSSNYSVSAVAEDDWDDMYVYEDIRPPVWPYNWWNYR